MIECNTIIEANKEIDELKRINKKLNKVCIDYSFKIEKLEKENEKLISTIKEVIELLSEEVDLFIDKATEYDINACIKLKELDNKDAFYMAIATKKAIKMLKEHLE